jgi:hypothetical protein
MRTIRRTLPWSTALLGLALLWASGARGGSSGLVVGGPPPNLFLLYTGDVIGYLDPCG